MSVDKKISQLPVATSVATNDFTVLVDGSTSTNKRATVAQLLAASGGGTVTSVSVSGSNGITSSGSPITSTGTIALSLGAITPTSVVASGAVSGSNLSNTNTGDQTITLTGDVTGSGTGSFAATIAAGVVTNAKLADMTGTVIKGRSSGTGAPNDLSMASVNAMLPVFVGDSGSGGTQGLVLAPTSGSGAAHKFLRADAQWIAPDLNDLTPSQAGNSGKVLSTNGTTTSWSSVGVGSVTSVSVTTANGVSGTVATATTTPAITLALGAITPTSVAASGAISGSNLSGTNTGDQTTITGNAGSATVLQTARAINGVNFDGSASITVTAAGSTLSDTVPIAKGGTGQITAQAALNALLPSQAGAANKNLQSDGTNVSFVADAGGTVTSVAATAGTGISVSGSPITTSGTLTITNTAPDQIVALTGGTGITTSGTYPNFTVTNSAPDQTVALTASTGITTSGTYPNFTIANSAPDQTVAIAAGTGISVSGTYPSFTVTNSSPSSGGTVTSVSGTGTVNGISLSGTVTSTGNLTLGGALTGVDLTSQVTGTLPVANGGTGVATSTGTGSTVLSTSPQLSTVGVGAAGSASTNLLLAASTTSVSSLRILAGANPTSPVNGDVWASATAAFIRLNGTTYQFGSLP